MKALAAANAHAEAVEAAEFVHAGAAGAADDSSDDDVGPQPMMTPDGAKDANVSYGGAMRPGEGAAIAQFVQANKRIPRRGEVGWDGEQIAGLEESGFVMSGSRHKRMNAVRMRKENQVYSAEEKRALALFNYEQQQQREAEIMAKFRDMVGTKGAPKDDA